MFDPPKLRDDLPRYPGTLQLLRVTAATVPGPTGGTSTGPGIGNVPPSLLYISATQQLRTDTLAPRDREPCFAVDVSGFGLVPAGQSYLYYLGRLAGTYQTLPVYEVVTFPGGSSFPQGAAGLPGLTPAQLSLLNASLTPSQLTSLNNLSACQLQVLLQLPVVNIQLLGNMTSTQVQNVLDALQFTPLQQLVTQLQPAQVLVLSSAYPLMYQALLQALTPTQAVQLLGALTSQQMSTLVSLTPAQFQVVAQLTTAQQQALTNLTPAQVPILVGQLTSVQISLLLTNLSTGQLQLLTNNFTSDQIQQLLLGLTAAQLAALTNAQLLALATTPAPLLGNQSSYSYVATVTGQPTSAPSALTGYAPVVVDTTGKIWAYVSGVWTSLGGGSSSSLNSTGTTTNAFVTVWDIVNAGGLHGGFSVKNTGPTNSLSWRVTYTDMFGTATTSTSQIANAGIDGNGSFDLAAIGAGGGSLTSEGNYPIKEAKLEVMDTIGGSHTTYSVWRSVVG